MAEKTQRTQNKHELIKLLIENPQTTDKELSKKLGVSQPTIARYKAELQSKGIIHHYVAVNNQATGAFSARSLLYLTFNQGITRSSVKNALTHHNHNRYLFNKHVAFAHLGDKDGYVVLVLLLESRATGDLVEIVNAEFIPLLKSNLGEFCIKDMSSIPIEETIHLLHNYDASTGKAHPASTIFVTDRPLE